MTTPNSQRRKKGGLGGLLTNPAEPVEVTPGQEEIDLPAPPPAPAPEDSQQTAEEPAPAPPPRPATGGLLPRGRRAKEPVEKMTVAVPLAVFNGLDALLERDGTLRKDEVADALRQHLRRKGIEIEEG